MHVLKIDFYTYKAHKFNTNSLLVFLPAASGNDQ